MLQPSAIARNLPACRRAGSCWNWPIRGTIRPRNPAFTASWRRWATAAPWPGQSAGPVPGRQPVTKPARLARSGSGSEARPGVTGIKLSGGQFEAPNTWMPGPVAGLFFCRCLIVDISAARSWAGKSRSARVRIWPRCWCKRRSGRRPASRDRWCCTPTPAFGWGRPPDRCHDESDAGKARHHGVLPPPARKPRQPDLRGAVAPLQISPGLASQGLCCESRRAGPGEILSQLV